MAGRFVVLEGIDGAGTTTHTARLADRLRAAKVEVRPTREPSDGPIGAMIRQILTGRIVVPGGRAPGWASMALLFAADRMDHVERDRAGPGDRRRGPVRSVRRVEPGVPERLQRHRGGRGGGMDSLAQPVRPPSRSDDRP